MRSIRWFTPFLSLLFLAAFLRAECTAGQDQRSSKTGGWQITDFIVTGTQTLGTDDLPRIEGKLTGSCFDEDSEELKVRISMVFQDRGYPEAEDKNVAVKVSDSLTIPKQATLEAEVAEGIRYKFGEIKFVGNHAFSGAKLRSELSLKTGALFERNKIVGGLDSLRLLYSSDGFMDWNAFSDVQKLSDAAIVLTVRITEGPQYRMGKVKVFAPKQTADKLEESWELAEGTTFDPTYVNKFLSANSSLLPKDFASGDVRIIRDCLAASVKVVFQLRSLESSESIPKKIPCETSSDAATSDVPSGGPKR